MTKKQFQKIEEKHGFTLAMKQLWEESDCIKDYECLKDLAIHALSKDNVGFAVHILNAIWNSEGDSDFYYYIPAEGTLCTPRCLNNVDDVEKYVGFDKE